MLFPVISTISLQELVVCILLPADWKLFNEAARSMAKPQTKAARLIRNKTRATHEVIVSNSILGGRRADAVGLPVVLERSVPLRFDTSTARLASISGDKIRAAWIVFAKSCVFYTIWRSLAVTGNTVCYRYERQTGFEQISVFYVSCSFSRRCYHTRLDTLKNEILKKKKNIVFQHFILSLLPVAARLLHILLCNIIF